MIDDLLQLQQDVVAFHTRVYTLLSRLQDQAVKFNQSDRADAILLVKLMHDLFKDMRSEALRTRELLDKQLGYVWAKQFEANPEDAKRSVRGSYATVTPQIRQGVSLPKRKSEEYTLLMKALGFSDEICETGAVQIHWPGLTEYLAQLAEEGKPLPPGISQDSAYPIYTSSVRQHSDVELSIQNELRK